MRPFIHSRLLIASLVGFLHAGITVAQTRNLTIEDAVFASRRGLTPETLDQLQWIPGTETFSYLKSTREASVLLTETPQASKATPVTALTDLNRALAVLHRDTLVTFPDITWQAPDVFTFETGGSVFEYRPSRKMCTAVADSIPDAAEHNDWNPQRKIMAYTLGNNLWIASASGNVAITADKDPGIVNGDIVHREEFGIHKGTFWSPAGNLLAFYRMDETMVADYPIIETDNLPATARTIKYPMAGGVSHQVTVGVYDLNSGRTAFLKTGMPADQYLTNIAWHPDESAIYVVVLNRDQNHLWMKKYDPKTGNELGVLFEETDADYIQPLNPMAWDKSGNSFVWQSRRDGFNHLYLYDKTGKLIRQLTSGTWEVTAFGGFNSRSDRVLFTAAKSAPVNRDLLSVDLKSGSVTTLSSGSGVHKMLASSSGNYVIDEFSAPGTPRDYYVVSGAGKKIRTVLSAPDPLTKYAPVRIDMFTIKNDKGDSLYCRMLRPNTFDSTRRYPVIVYVYGGPNVQLITNNWTEGADMWMRFMAQRGFIIFTVENRGTPNRGKAFEQATFRQLGEAEMEDQIAGAKYLMNQKYVDPSRMGIYGWSYGGFMTISMMTRNPGIFKAAVAGGPVIDWSLYEVMYTERYMDTPETNPLGYSKSNLLNYIRNLKGNMLLIHGTSDNVVVWQHSLKYLKEAINEGVQFDYFVYPGHEHNVKGKDRVHLLTKVSNYFFEHLQH